MSTEARAKFDRLIVPRLDEGFKLSRWLVGNTADAEDVLQEACMRAFLGMDRLIEHNVRAWFLTIVRNSAYSWLQKHRSGIILSHEQLQPHDQAVLDRGGLAAEPLPTAEDVLIAQEHENWLEKAIDGLPLATKEVVVLREYHHLSYREIAEVAGLPIGTVMSRLARARQHLSAEFKRRGNES